jgi:hypothetical protein
MDAYHFHHYGLGNWSAEKLADAYAFEAKVISKEYVKGDRRQRRVAAEVLVLRNFGIEVPDKLVVNFDETSCVGTISVGSITALVAEKIEGKLWLIAEQGF